MPPDGVHIPSLRLAIGLDSSFDFHGQANKIAIKWLRLPIRTFSSLVHSMKSMSACGRWQLKHRPDLGLPKEITVESTQLPTIHAIFPEIDDVNGSESRQEERMRFANFDKRLYPTVTTYVGSDTQPTTDRIHFLDGERR